MKRIDNNLLMSRWLRQSRFLLLSMFLMAFISLSGTTSTVFAQSTAEVCRETEKVLRQLEREAQELDRMIEVKQNQSYVRDRLSDMEFGSLVGMSELVTLSRWADVEIPKGSDGRTKQAAQLTPAERSALQRTIYPVLKREFEEAVNTPWDRLNDRKAKNDYQIQIRRQRMNGLNCAQLLKDGTVESGETPDISGTWKYGTEWVYKFAQTGSTFTWSLEKNGEAAKGTIKGKEVSATWTNSKGGGSATGTVTQVDSSGKATRIAWSNGAVFTR